MIGTGTTARVAVVGVGGAGCNVVGSMHDAGCGFRTVVINTDREGLAGISADVKIHICKGVLKGEGARGDAVLGKKCADIHEEEIREALSGFDAVFVVAGLGGGTGTGAMPVVVDAALAQGAVAYAIGINPFSFEGRGDAARAGWARVRAICERTLLLDNDKVLKVMPELTAEQALLQVNRTIEEHIVSVTESMYSGFAAAGSPTVSRTEGREARYPVGALVA